MLAPTSRSPQLDTPRVIETLTALVAEVNAHGFVVSPPHVAVARHLIGTGRASDARRLLYCPDANEKRRRDRFVCRLPMCPGCSERRARRLAAKMREMAEGYARPMTLLARAPSRTLDDLVESVETLRDCLFRLRRRRWFVRTCPSGVACIEVPLTRDGRRWNTHVHALVDLRIERDELETWTDRARGEWIELVGSGGDLGVEPLESEWRFSRYATKCGRKKSYAPAPWELSPRLRLIVAHALYRRRLLTTWGNPRAKKEVGK